MYKIGIIGDRDSVLPFRALGIDVYETSGGAAAKKLVNKLAKDGYGVIYITEHVACDILETIDRYTKEITPTIVLIPSNQGSLGIGKNRIKENIQKAIGMNIL